MCPQFKAKCGDKQELNLEEGDSEDISASDIQEGETCTWRIKSNCSSPAFALESGATNGIGITFMEFDEESLGTAKKGKGRNASPKNGMPQRG